MLKVDNLKYFIDKNEPRASYDELILFVKERLIKKYHVNGIKNLELVNKSIDARGELCYNLSAIFNCDNEKHYLKYFKEYEEAKELRELKELKKTKNKKVLVVGMGPAGLFNALVLNKAGYDVTLIDRGSCVEKRVEAVNDFFNKGIFSPLTNVQYGEGGAGTFSDGKLGTNVNSPYINYVLETFYNFGAEKNILYESHPHIGTDILRKVLVNFRNDLISNGVKVYFETKLIDINYPNVVVRSNGEEFVWSFDYVVLACGHSAEDTYEMLYKKKMELEPKPFSMGVRIEHLQEDISRSQYHGDYPFVEPAEYKLVCHLDSGRTVYSFCMCPGGYVVNASSSEGYLVCNGMSNNLRDNVNANAALLVNVEVNDYYKNSPLDGAYFQRYYEKKAFDYCSGYNAPVQKVCDFMDGVKSNSLGKVTPTIKPGYEFSNLWEILPGFVCESLKDALPKLDKKIRGYFDPDAVLTGIESRSSSPIRIKRMENGETSLKNIYAVGEGSGYAGGITTSSIDGIKIALKLIENDK